MAVNSTARLPSRARRPAPRVRRMPCSSAPLLQTRLDAREHDQDPGGQGEEEDVLHRQHPPVHDRPHLLIRASTSSRVTLGKRCTSAGIMVSCSRGQVEAGDQGGASVPNRAGDETTKKLTLKLSHWTLRRLVTGALSLMAGYEEGQSVTQLIPKVSASPASTENWASLAPVGHQSPARIGCRPGVVGEAQVELPRGKFWARGLA